MASTDKHTVSTTDNLVHLDNLTEATILNAVEQRFHNDQIYTYVGDMLLAVNPYKSLGLLYGDATRSRHVPDAPVPSTPHVYAAAQRAYKNLTTHNRNQCCLISGESGAGKTESAKFFMSQLLNFEDDTSFLQRRILESLPLLEAFGNAKTKLNDNSSRFGKYIEVMYANGRVHGAKISHYLLEKARVTARDEGEASYHVFYYVLTGAPQWIRDGLALLDEKCYNYLHPGGHNIPPETAMQEVREIRRRSSKYEYAGADLVSDVVKYEELIECLEVLNFNEEELGHVHAVIMAVLVLGNIDFAPDDGNDGASVVQSSAPLMHVGLLCGVPARDLEERLTFNTIHVRGETLSTPRTVEAARVARDTLAQHMYDRMFHWLVKRVNQNMSPHSKNDDMAEGSLRGIGVLDIFGFEDFGANTFDQLCINTANEQLQHFFNQSIFEWELREYKKEGIEGSDLIFDGNQAQISLLLGKPMGLFSLLDEACKLPRANITDKFAHAFKKSSLFKRDRTRPDMFGIVHYAGCVWYTTDGMLERNRNTQLHEFNHLMLKSPVELFRELFAAPLGRGHSRATRRKRAERGPTWRLRGILKDNKGGDNNTLGSMFVTSLHSLMAKVEVSEPHFIRCIKPNTGKQHGNFDRKFVDKQLAYGGVLETTRIRREGFAVRLKFADFVATYKLLAFAATDRRVKGNINDCTVILNAAGITGWQLGRSKVFLKYNHSVELVEQMYKLHEAADTIARAYRKHAGRQKLRRLKDKIERERALEEEVRKREQAEAEAAQAQARQVESQAGDAMDTPPPEPTVPDTTPLPNVAVTTTVDSTPRPDATGNETVQASHRPSDNRSVLKHQEAERNAHRAALLANQAAVTKQLSHGATPQPTVVSTHAQPPLLDTITTVPLTSAPETSDSSFKSKRLARQGSVTFFLDDATPAPKKEVPVKKVTNKVNNNVRAFKVKTKAPPFARHKETPTTTFHTDGSDDGPKENRTGTITRGDVGAAKAMFLAMMSQDAGPEKPRRQNAQPSFNVKSKAKALKIQFPPMAGANLSHGPAMPWAHKPWRMPITRIEEEEMPRSEAETKAALDAFLAELSIQRLYSYLCDDAGIREPSDFLLFDQDELIDLGFKPAHAKKVLNAAEAQQPVEVS
eukprot:m.118127 g.118127  ORF g.118127 m.118127 type:complete len:1139 (+) comp10964_c0_seq3:288-3704(+)